MGKSIIKGNPARYKLSLGDGAREAPARRLGLGATDMSSNAVTQMLRDAMGCPVTSIPVIEHTTWDVAGPILDEEITQSFGTPVDIFNSGRQVAGVDTVQTTFVHPGILQTGIIVVAVGFHIFAEPVCFTAEGNSLSPAPANGQTSPASLDVYTGNDSGASLGLSGGQTLTPALLDWGWPMQYAAWHFINAYNFDWVVRQRYHLLSESARYIAYFSSFADEFGAGTSEVDVVSFARRANERYVEKGGIGSGIFLPINRRRQGSFLQTEVESSVARATRDYDLVPVTWGGLQLQNKLGNTQYRKLTLPYYIPANTPIGLQLNVSDEVQQSLFQQQLSITDGIGASVPPVETAYPNITAGADSGFPELSLDAAPGAFSQTFTVARARYKGGSLELSMLIKGFEVTDDFANAMTSGPLKAALQSEFGIQFCS